MSRTSILVGLVLSTSLMLCAIGCGEANKDASSGASATAKADPTQKAVATAKPVASAAPTVAVATGDLTTEADFEEEADAQIDSANMDAELSALDKEISEDK